MKKLLRFKKIRPTSPPDYLYIGAVTAITLFGFVMLASASSDLASARFGDSYYYLIHQFLNGLVPGLIGFALGISIYYHRWEKTALVLLVINIILLILIFTPLGVSTKGASRWLSIGGLSLQPGELLKLTFITYLASWLGKNQKRTKSFTEGFVPFLVFVGVIGLLLVKQPSTTIAAITMGAALIIYFVAGARLRFIIGLAALGIASVALLIAVTPYRFERVRTYLNPSSADALGEGYHRAQAMTAVGSGGLMGVGYGKSTTKLKYLPEPIGDSIFAVIAEELGFIGAVSLLAFYAIITLRGLAIAAAAPDLFGRLIATGFSAIIGLQAFVNIGAVSGILPLTGVPLPFVSYGGTALAVFLTMSGIIINISRYRK